MNKFYNNFLLFFLLILLAFLLTFSALNLINNPDLSNYIEIISNSDYSESTVEPMIALLSVVSKNISSILPLNSIFLTYFLHIFTIVSCVFYGLKVSFNGSIAKGLIGLMTWLSMYGVIQCLIQIRFGMASSIAFLLFSLSLFRRPNKGNKPWRFAYLAMITHYSSIFVATTILLLGRKLSFITSRKILLFHVGYAITLMLFKMSIIFSFLPEFMLARISIYINSEDTELVSWSTSLIALVLYILLLFRPTPNINKEDVLRLFGILSFLPYFIVPEIEILIRTGIPFQYLLITYLFLTYKKKSYLLNSTLPLIVFFSFKVWSNAGALLKYLG